MIFKKKIFSFYNKLNKIKIKTQKKLIFSIGNTMKKDSGDYYFTPPRIFQDFIIFGIVVYDDKTRGIDENEIVSVLLNKLGEDNRVCFLRGKCKQLKERDSN